MRFAFVCLLLTVSSVALARSGGLAASGCQGCHGGTAHTTTVDVQPASFMPGDTVTVTVTARGNGSNGGLYLTTTKGSFTLVSGQNTKLVNGDVVQSSPKASSGGAVSFQVRWTAPTTPGGTQFSAFTVLGNGDGRSGGDSTGEGSRSAVFGCTGITFFRDFDADGLGNATNGTTLDCAVPQGYAARDGDCDDYNNLVFPGATERCNGRDDNCNTLVDEGLAAASTWPDLDGDGYGDRRGAVATGCSSSGRAPNDQDCDDADARVHPGGTEVCNLKDDDCNGRLDENVRVRCGTGWCEALGITCDPLSCTPGRPMTERCNFLDDDCDGEVDEGALCAAGQACVRGTCVVTEVEVIDGGVDHPAPTDGGPLDGGTTQPRPTMQPVDSCASVPVPVVVAAVLLLVRRRR